MEIEIERGELAYLAAGILILLLFWQVLFPSLDALLSPLWPPFAYLAYHIILFPIFYSLGWILSKRHAFSFKFSLSALSFYIGMDNLLPPFLVRWDGTFVSDAPLAPACIDQALASLWMLLGIRGHLLWIFTYIISSFLLMFLIPTLVMTSGQIRELLSEGLAS